MRANKHLFKYHKNTIDVVSVENSEKSALICENLSLNEEMKSVEKDIYVAWDEIQEEMKLKEASRNEGKVVECSVMLQKDSIDA